MLNDPATDRYLSADRMHTFLALGVCLVVVLMQTLLPEYRRPTADSLRYAQVIADLGPALTASLRDANLMFGTHYGPVFPAFGLLVAAIDPTLVDTFKCVSQDGAVCDLGGLTSFFVAQAICAALTVFFIFLAVRQLTGDPRVAWLALVIVLASKVFANYTTLILMECLTFFILSVFIWLFACIVSGTEDNRKHLFAAGVVLAVTALTREAYYYLAHFSVVLLFVHFWLIKKRPIGRAFVHVALFGAGLFVVFGPWWLRNYLSFDLPAVIGGYGSTILIERLAYNNMTWAEWGVSLIYFLPDFGDDLARKLFDRELWIRLTWYDPASFYSMGRGEFFHEVRRVAAAENYSLSFLLREYVWKDLVKHVAVSISLALRGQWVGNYVSLVGFLLLPACFWILRQKDRALPFLMFCLPLYFMVGLYAFATVSVVRYNEPLIAVFAMSGAVVLVHLADRAWLRLRRKTGG